MTHSPSWFPWSDCLQPLVAVLHSSDELLQWLYHSWWQHHKHCQEYYYYINIILILLLIWYGAVTARQADLCICLGTSLQILPCAKLPLLTKKSGGRVAIVNLQVTRLDSRADLVLHDRVDAVMTKVRAWSLVCYMTELTPSWQRLERDLL